MPLLVYLLFSPFLISAMSWWCVGINHVPALLGSCMALAAHVRYLRDRRRSHLIASVLWVLVGLAFAELTLYVYLPMLVITAGYFATGRLGERIGFVWDYYRPAVLAHVLLGVAYIGIYLKTSWSPAPSTTAVDWSQFIGNAALTTVPLGAVGGPGHWHIAWAAQFEVAPTGAVRLLSYVVVITVFALSAMTRDRAMRAWLIPALQLALSSCCWRRPGSCSVQASPWTCVSTRRWLSVSPWPSVWLSYPFRAPASARPSGPSTG